jgi:CubicO group peptidase (beta-lactamase class C family)
MKSLWLPVCVALFLASCTPIQDEPIQWPTDGWAVSPPGEQGMDAARLWALDSSLADERGNIDAILVIRNGRVVYEKHYPRDYDAMNEGRGQAPGLYNYYDPEWHPYFQRGELHTMQSVTKSVTSALIGIAIGRGEISGVHVPVLDFFEDYEVANLDEWKRSMTLYNLLTMKAGIKWDEDSVPYTDPENSCAGMENSDDWIQFVIDQPMSHEPGTVFIYNSGASELLSLIIKKATGQHVDQYAEEHLFGPLGITSYFWKKTPTGFPDTEGGLYLTARDLAKFGYLYLQDGVWDRARVLPEDWVAASVERSVEDTDWIGMGYGYQWWLVPWGSKSDSYAYAAIGYGGQRLFVVPEMDVVAVFTGWNIEGVPALDPRFALDAVLEAAGAPLIAASQHE